MIQRFGLTVFEHYATGRLMFQDQSGAAYPDRSMSSMQGSYSLVEGALEVAQELAEQL